jgi:hypothetical protein
MVDNEIPGGIIDRRFNDFHCDNGKTVGLDVATVVPRDLLDQIAAANEMMGMCAP